MLCCPKFCLFETGLPGWGYCWTLLLWTIDSGCRWLLLCSSLPFVQSLQATGTCYCALETRGVSRCGFRLAAGRRVGLEENLHQLIHAIHIYKLWCSINLYKFIMYYTVFCLRFGSISFRQIVLLTSLANWMALLQVSATSQRILLVQMLIFLCFFVYVCLCAFHVIIIQSHANTGNIRKNDQIISNNVYFILYTFIFTKYIYIYQTWEFYNPSCKSLQGIEVKRQPTKACPAVSILASKRLRRGAVTSNPLGNWLLRPLRQWKMSQMDSNLSQT